MSWLLGPILVLKATNAPPYPSSTTTYCTLITARKGSLILKACDQTGSIWMIQANLPIPRPSAYLHLQVPVPWQAARSQIGGLNADLFGGAMILPPTL